MKRLWPTGVLACGLVASLSGAGQPATEDIRMDLEHHTMEWGNGEHTYHNNDNGQAVLTVEAPPVSGMYPGAVKPLTLTVTNTGRRDIRITDMSGQLARTSRAGCAPIAQNLVVRRWQSPASNRLLVPARSRRTVGSLPLYMPGTVANACQRTTFTIRLTAVGTQVGR